jgi:hypothetical protein
MIAVNAGPFGDDVQGVELHFQVEDLPQQGTKTPSIITNREQGEGGAAQAIGSGEQFGHTGRVQRTGLAFLVEYGRRCLPRGEQGVQVGDGLFGASAQIGVEEDFTTAA